MTTLWSTILQYKGSNANLLTMCQMQNYYSNQLQALNKTTIFYIPNFIWYSITDNSYIYIVTTLYQQMLISILVEYMLKVQ